MNCWHPTDRLGVVRKGPKDWERKARTASGAVGEVRTDTSFRCCRQNQRHRHRDFYFRAVEGEDHHSETWQLPIPLQRLWQR